MSEELLPCPFCGAFPEHKLNNPYKNGYVKHGRINYRPCILDLFVCTVKEWNTRSASSVSSKSEIENCLYALLWRCKQEGMDGNLNLQVHDCRKKIANAIYSLLTQEKGI